MTTIYKLRRIFDRGTKVRLLILMSAIIAAGLLDMMVLGLIAPIVEMTLDSSAVYANRYIHWVYRTFGFTNVGTFMALMAFALAMLYVIKALYLYTLNRVKFRFTARRQALLSVRLLEKILGYSYLFHTHRNVAELNRIINGDVTALFGMINTMLALLIDFFMALFIFIFLLVVSPTMTLLLVGLALACVFVYFKAFSRKIKLAGEQSRDASIVMSKSVLQALGGIKEVKALRREGYFYGTFKTSSDTFVNINTKFQVLDSLPKMVIEVVCFGGTFALVGIFLLRGANLTVLAPQISVFVFAAFRLLPAIIRLVGYYNSILLNRVAVDAVYKSLYEEKDMASEIAPEAETYATVGHDIVVRGIGFRYPKITVPVLDSADFIVPHNKSVAFIGPSGAGKTTLVDLILGVLSPDRGGVYYRGKAIHTNLDDWSKQIGYIPQQIYLLDDSIRANVAFGVDSKEIREDKVWHALEKAQLADYVRALPDGINTFVGDRGVRLSGGQRQRVGIARALYEDPAVLVLDEATSSLDNDTEKAVMDAVKGLQGEKTMIIVAHRLSTIEHCDIVYKVEDKTVVRVR